MRLVSACLLGVNCNYRGGNFTHPGLVALFRSGGLLPICPELLGGLPLPRAPAEIQGGDGCAVLEGRARVKTKSGEDVTEEFLRGANAVCDLAEAAGAREALLIEQSPSCGAGLVYDGSFTGGLVEGEGVTAAMLRSRGIVVKTIYRPAVAEAETPGDEEPGTRGKALRAL